MDLRAVVSSHHQGQLSGRQDSITSESALPCPAPVLVVCRHSPTLVDALWALPVVQLAAGDAHSAALTSSGQMFVWGSNHFGQLGLVRDGDPLSIRVHKK